MIGILMECIVTSDFSQPGFMVKLAVNPLIQETARERLTRPTWNPTTE